MMPSDKSEKIKFYIVIGLAVILVVVAYFRFWHQKGGTGPDRLATLPAQTKPAATAMPIDRQPDERAADRPADVALPSVKRDIFRPRNIPSAAVGRPRKTKPVKSKPTPAPDFKLGGTIVSGGESIAIINGRFLRTGDTIAAYKVVRIGKDKVELVSGIKNIELKMIKDE
jgi:hypothetical protein